MTNNLSYWLVHGSDLHDLVSAYRVVTPTEPGGIDKAGLGLQLACDLLSGLADGRWFVEQASLCDPALVGSIIG